MNNPKNRAIEDQRAKVEEFRSALVAIQSNPGFEPKSTEPLKFLKEALQAAKDNDDRIRLLESTKEALDRAEQELQRMEAEWEQKCKKAREGMARMAELCERLKDIGAQLSERLVVVDRTAKELDPDISAVYPRWYRNTVSDGDMQYPVPLVGSSGDSISIYLQSGLEFKRHLSQAEKQAVEAEQN